MKALVVYYSHTQNTKKIAELIAEATGGTLLELQPETSYPQSYKDLVAQAKKEIDAGFLPTLQNSHADVSDYDTVFVGTPNWCSTIAPPVATFLTEHNLEGKTVIPFCTHGGGGLGGIARDTEKLCPKSKIGESFDIYGDGGIGAKEKVAAFLKQMGISNH